MNDQTPSGFRAKMEQLRAKFSHQLPTRIDDARRCFADLQQQPATPNLIAPLHLVLHSMRGTGQSLGFTELGAAAARGEQLVEQLSENLSTNDNLMAAIAQCLAQIETAAGVLVHGEPAAGSEETAPSYELPQASAALSARADQLVYLCDDDPVSLALIASQLLCFGYQCELFHGIDELLAAVEREMPTVLIMDIMFPEGADAGTAAMAALGRTGQQCPVIFLSSRTDFEARLNAIRAGGEAYFCRPVNVLELVAALDRLIAPPTPEPYRVLVVDDEPDMSRLHCTILEQAGMVTRSAHQPQHVLELATAFRPDLVLMDMYMPVCSGHELSKLLRQIPDFVGLPIVFLSRETDKALQFMAMSIGADGFLTKPIAPDELVMSVSLRAERMRILRGLMVKDSLTGLFNHTACTQLLESALDSAQRQGGSVSFAMIDLDSFKAVNDTHGHPAGDQVLLALARVLRQRLRRSDLVGRYGGEEFAVIMHDVTPEKAHELMDELRSFFGKVVIHADHTHFSCTFSCGIASSPQFATVTALREAADGAMYQAKRTGRNRVVTWLAPRG